MCLFWAGNSSPSYLKLTHTQGHLDWPMATSPAPLESRGHVIGPLRVCDGSRAIQQTVRLEIPVDGPPKAGEPRYFQWQPKWGRIIGASCLFVACSPLVSVAGCRWALEARLKSERNGGGNKQICKSIVSSSTGDHGRLLSSGRSKRQGAPSGPQALSQKREEAKVLKIDSVFHSRPKNSCLFAGKI